MSILVTVAFNVLIHAPACQQIQVTPLPPGDDNDNTNNIGRDLSFFIRRPDSTSGNDSSSSSSQEWSGGVTDETSLGHIVSAYEIS